MKAVELIKALLVLFRKKRYSSIGSMSSVISQYLSVYVRHFSIVFNVCVSGLGVCLRTCVSDRLSAVASSTLSGVDRYRWISNLFSRPESCESEKTVRAFLRLQCLPGNSAWCWNKAGICIPARSSGWELLSELSEKKQTETYCVHFTARAIYSLHFNCDFNSLQSRFAFYTFKIHRKKKDKSLQRYVHVVKKKTVF